MDLETVAIKQEVRYLPIHIGISDICNGKVTRLKEILDDSPISSQLNITSGCPECSCILNIDIILHQNNDIEALKEITLEESLVPITVLEDIKTDVLKQDNEDDSDPDFKVLPKAFIEFQPVIESGDNLSQTYSSDDSYSDDFSDEDNVPIDSLMQQLSKDKSRDTKHVKTGKKLKEDMTHLKQLVKETESLPQHVCLFCYDQFKDKVELEHHLTDHSLVCKHCGDRTFSNLRQLSVHMRRIHSDIRRSMGQFLPCPHCKRRIINTVFIRHVGGCKTVQNKQKTEKNSGKKKFKPLKRDRPPGNLDKHVCVCCYETFKTQSEYKTHMKNHSLVCKFCGRDTYKNHKTLYRHVRTHHGEFRPDTDTFMECPRCGEKIVNQGFSRHFDSCQANEKGRPKCQICQKDFSTWKTVLAHIDNIHLGTKHYTCELCGAQFSNSLALNNHTLKHMTNDDRPYKCDLCYKSYSVKFSIEKHMRLEHIVQKEPRPVYPCDVCGVNLVSKKGLKTHKKRHDDSKQYQCSFCSRGFVSKAELQNHERTHTGDRP